MQKMQKCGKKLYYFKNATCIALHFSSSFVGSFIPMERNFITSKMQPNAENAFINGM